MLDTDGGSLHVPEFKNGKGITEQRGRADGEGRTEAEGGGRGERKKTFSGMRFVGAGTGYCFLTAGGPVERGGTEKVRAVWAPRSHPKREEILGVDIRTEWHTHTHSTHTKKEREGAGERASEREMGYERKDGQKDHENKSRKDKRREI